MTSGGRHQTLLLIYLSVAMLPMAQVVFLVRPFLEGPIHVQRPTHNFWPYVPLSSAVRGENDSRFFQKPDHNFWPFIPVNNRSSSRSNNSTESPYFHVPRHNFWPFIPVATPVAANGSKPEPVTTPTPTTSATPLPDNDYDYGEVLFKSILFYEAQRSGWLPENRKVTWRGHSALEDRGEYGEDLSGGWYDAGDYVKFGFPLAGATSMLLLGLIEFRDAYKSTGLLADMYDCVRWPLDYFVKAHPTRYEFYAQVADPYVDHSYWGRPEDMTMYRPAYKLSPEAPGSDVIGETAAALAAGAIAFKHIDKEYSNLLLQHASELYEFADRHRGIYSDSLPIVQEFYSSSGYNDELAWAAAWLYRATGDKRYLRKAEENYVSSECWAVSWDAKDCLAALLLYKLTKKAAYREDIERTMKSWMPGGSVDYTPAGLAFRTPWGPLRYTANMATLALVAANAGIEPTAYRRWARSQIHYMLGDSGNSFIVGFGNDPPVRPHHASSSCPPSPTQCSWSHYYTSAPNPVTLYGALVGGPALDDSYYDNRDDYYQNEVTCDYNAGFQSAVAGLMQLKLIEKQVERLYEGNDTDLVSKQSKATFSRNEIRFYENRHYVLPRGNLSHSFGSNLTKNSPGVVSGARKTFPKTDTNGNISAKNEHYDSRDMKKIISNFLFNGRDVFSVFKNNNSMNNSHEARRDNSLVPPISDQGALSIESQNPQRSGAFEKLSDFFRMDVALQRKAWAGLLQGFGRHLLKTRRRRRKDIRPADYVTISQDGLNQSPPSPTSPHGSCGLSSKTQTGNLFPCGCREGRPLNDTRCGENIESRDNNMSLPLMNSVAPNARSSSENSVLFSSNKKKDISPGDRLSLKTILAKSATRLVSQAKNEIATADIDLPQKVNSSIKIRKSIKMYTSRKNDQTFSGKGNLHFLNKFLTGIRNGRVVSGRVSQRRSKTGQTVHEADMNSRVSIPAVNTTRNVHQSNISAFNKNDIPTGHPLRIFSLSLQGGRIRTVR